VRESDREKAQKEVKSGGENLSPQKVCFKARMKSESEAKAVGEEKVRKKLRQRGLLKDRGKLERKRRKLKSTQTIHYLPIVSSVAKHPRSSQLVVVLELIEMRVVAVLHKRQNNVERKLREEYVREKASTRKEFLF